MGCRLLMHYPTYASRPTGTYMAAKAVVAAGGPTLDALCILHAMDYACFPQQLPVPAACRRVLETMHLAG